MALMKEAVKADRTFTGLVPALREMLPKDTGSAEVDDISLEQWLSENNGNIEKVSRALLNALYLLYLFCFFAFLIYL